MERLAGATEKEALHPREPGMKTKGQIEYEADVKKRPNYHDGKPRKKWADLGEVEQWSWQRGSEGK